MRGSNADDGQTQDTLCLAALKWGLLDPAQRGRQPGTSVHQVTSGAAVQPEDWGLTQDPHLGSDDLLREARQALPVSQMGERALATAYWRYSLPPPSITLPDCPELQG